MVNKRFQWLDECRRGYHDPLSARCVLARLRYGASLPVRSSAGGLLTNLLNVVRTRCATVKPEVVNPAVERAVAVPAIADKQRPSLNKTHFLAGARFCAGQSGGALPAPLVGKQVDPVIHHGQENPGVRRQVPNKIRLGSDSVELEVQQAGGLKLKADAVGHAGVAGRVRRADEKNTRADVARLASLLPEPDR